MYSHMVDINAKATVDDMQAAMRPLANLSNNALREMVDDDQKIEEHIKSIQMTTRQIKDSQNDMIMTQNKSLAEYNLTFEPLLEAGRCNLKQVMVQIAEVRNQVLEKEEQLRKNSGNLSVETALALLQTAAAESEEDSEKVAEMFYQKDLDVDEFLESFQEKRKRMHLRKVKAEKMADLATERNNRPVSAPRRAAPLPPYPVGPNPFYNLNNM